MLVSESYLIRLRNESTVQSSLNSYPHKSRRTGEGHSPYRPLVILELNRSTPSYPDQGISEAEHARFAEQRISQRSPQAANSQERRGSDTSGLRRPSPGLPSPKEISGDEGNWGLNRRAVGRIRV
ncbi:hypothetical protein MLD38_025406 [Melastoma candidum]|uniref:Uncharacterized protein n=1 Tax=Melastoma candidum TaxID=119954 RepID=A0ACB9NVC9_9MYRT|nr:hypothetical protein MLD38_025406 [Melastoma candidum]